VICRMAFLDDWSTRVSRWLARYSLAVLRISLGLVFVGFGVLKFVLGLSPAEDLASETMQALTLGLIPEGLGLLLRATLETAVGLLLLTGRFLRLGLGLLGLAMVGILAPRVLFPDRPFAGLAHAPTLEGQYVLKDVVLLAAGLVLAASARHGAVVSRTGQVLTAPAPAPHVG
jgi:uncharacterized membrane protein YkgB